MRMTALTFAIVLMAVGASRGAACAEIKVLTAGAFKQVLLAMLPQFEPQSDIGSVDAFKKALLAASSIAYIDPAAGGSSGIYVAGLLERLGIAAEMKGKSRLISGGAVAEHVARGEAELGIHQISEILPVKGITLVGPLPAEIQSYTIYAAGVSINAKQADAAKDLLKALTGPSVAEVLRSKGMDPP